MPSYSRRAFVVTEIIIIAGLIISLIVGTLAVSDKAQKFLFKKKAAGDECMLVGDGNQRGCWCTVSGWKNHCFDPNSPLPENADFSTCETECKAKSVAEAPAPAVCTGIKCGGGECTDGRKFDGDDCYTYGACDARAESFCGKGNVKPPAAPVEPSPPPINNLCDLVGPGSTCPDTAGTTAWGQCKISGKSDADCKAEAEKAYNNATGQLGQITTSSEYQRLKQAGEAETIFSDAILNAAKQAAGVTDSNQLDTKTQQALQQAQADFKSRALTSTDAGVDPEKLKEAANALGREIGTQAKITGKVDLDKAVITTKTTDSVPLENTPTQTTTTVQIDTQAVYNLRQEISNISNQITALEKRTASVQGGIEEDIEIMNLYKKLARLDQKLKTATKSEADLYSKAGLTTSQTTELKTKIDAALADNKHQQEVFNQYVSPSLKCKTDEYGNEDCSERNSLFRQLSPTNQSLATKYIQRQQDIEAAITNPSSIQKKCAAEQPGNPDCFDPKLAFKQVIPDLTPAETADVQIKQQRYTTATIQNIETQHQATINSAAIKLVNNTNPDADALAGLNSIDQAEAQKRAALIDNYLSCDPTTPSCVSLLKNLSSLLPPDLVVNIQNSKRDQLVQNIVSIKSKIGITDAEIMDKCRKLSGSGARAECRTTASSIEVVVRQILASVNPSVRQEVNTAVATTLNVIKTNERLANLYLTGTPAEVAAECKNKKDCLTPGEAARQTLLDQSTLTPEQKSALVAQREQTLINAQATITRTQSGIFEHTSAVCIGNSIKITTITNGTSIITTQPCKYGCQAGTCIQPTAVQLAFEASSSNKDAATFAIEKCVNLASALQKECLTRLTPEEWTTLKTKTEQWGLFSTKDLIYTPENVAKVLDGTVKLAELTKTEDDLMSGKSTIVLQSWQRDLLYDKGNDLGLRLPEKITVSNQALVVANNLTLGTLAKGTIQQVDALRAKEAGKPWLLKYIGGTLTASAVPATLAVAVVAAPLAIPIIGTYGMAAFLPTASVALNVASTSYSLGHLSEACIAQEAGQTIDGVQCFMASANTLLMAASIFPGAAAGNAGILTEISRVKAATALTEGVSGLATLRQGGVAGAKAIEIYNSTLGQANKFIAPAGAIVFSGNAVNACIYLPATTGNFDGFSCGSSVAMALISLGRMANPTLEVARTLENADRLTNTTQALATCALAATGKASGFDCAQTLGFAATSFHFSSPHEAVSRLTGAETDMQNLLTEYQNNPSPELRTKFQQAYEAAILARVEIDSMLSYSPKANETDLASLRDIQNRVRATPNDPTLLSQLADAYSLVALKFGTKLEADRALAGFLAKSDPDAAVTHQMAYDRRFFKTSGSRDLKAVETKFLTALKNDDSAAYLSAKTNLADAQAHVTLTHGSLSDATQVVDTYRLQAARAEVEYLKAKQEYGQVFDEAVAKKNLYPGILEDQLIQKQQAFAQAETRYKTAAAQLEGANALLQPRIERSLPERIAKVTSSLSAVLVRIAPESSLSSLLGLDKISTALRGSDEFRNLARDKYAVVQDGNGWKIVPQKKTRVNLQTAEKINAELTRLQQPDSLNKTFYQNQVEIITKIVINNESAGLLLRAETGLGKTEVVIPAISAVKAKLGKPVLTVLDSPGKFQEYIQNLSPEAQKSGKLLSEMTESELQTVQNEISRKLLGEEGQVIILTNHTTPEELSNPRIRMVISDKDVIFQSLLNDERATVLMAKLKGGTIVADEAQLSLRLELDYIVARGQKLQLAGTPQEASFLAVLRSNKSLLGRAIATADLTRIRTELEIPTSKNGERVYSGKITQIEQEIASELNLGNDRNAWFRNEEFNRRLSSANSIIDYLGKRTGLDIKVGENGRPALSENNTLSGRTPSLSYDALALEYIGHLTLNLEGSPNSNDISINPNAVATNYALFLKNFSEIYGFTATPEYIAGTFSTLYGINLSTTGASSRQINAFFSRLAGNIAPVGDLTQAAQTASKIAKDSVSHVVLGARISTDEFLANFDSTVPLIIRHADGSIELTQNLTYVENGQEMTIREAGKINNKNEVNALLAIARDNNLKLVQLYEHGAHFGTDAQTRPADRLIVISDGNTTATTLEQSFGRGRSGQEALSLIHIGPETPNMETFTKIENQFVAELNLQAIKKAAENLVPSTLESMRQTALKNSSKYNTAKIDAYFEKLQLEYRESADLNLNTTGRTTTGAADLAESYNRSYLFLKKVLTDPALPSSVSRAYLSRVLDGSPSLGYSDQTLVQLSKSKTKTLPLNNVRNLHNSALAAAVAMEKMDLTNLAVASRTYAEASRTTPTELATKNAPQAPPKPKSNLYTLTINNQKLNLADSSIESISIVYTTGRNIVTAESFNRGAIPPAADIKKLIASLKGKTNLHLEIKTSSGQVNTINLESRPSLTSRVTAAVTNLKLPTITLPQISLPNFFNNPAFAAAQAAWQALTHPKPVEIATGITSFPETAKLNKTPLGAIPQTGKIKIDSLTPHEAGYVPEALDYYTNLISTNQKIPPIEITYYNGKIYTVDGANRTMAILNSGRESIEYVFIPFSKLSNSLKNLLKLVDGKEVKIPSKYTSSFPINPLRPADAIPVSAIDSESTTPPAPSLATRALTAAQAVWKTAINLKPSSAVSQTATAFLENVLLDQPISGPVNTPSQIIRTLLSGGTNIARNVGTQIARAIKPTLNKIQSGLADFLENPPSILQPKTTIKISPHLDQLVIQLQQADITIAPEKLADIATIPDSTLQRTALLSAVIEYGISHGLSDSPGSVIYTLPDALQKEFADVDIPAARNRAQATQALARITNPPIVQKIKDGRYVTNQDLLTALSSASPDQAKLISSVLLARSSSSFDPRRELLKIVEQEVSLNPEQLNADFESSVRQILYEANNAVVSGKYDPLDLRDALTNIPDPYGIFPELEMRIASNMTNDQIAQEIANIITNKTNVAFVIVPQSDSPGAGYFLFNFKGKTYGVYNNFDPSHSPRGERKFAYELNPETSFDQAEKANQAHRENFKIRFSQNTTLPYEPDPFTIDYKNKQVFRTGTQIDAVVINKNRLSETPTLRTPIHELGHIVEQTTGSLLTKTPYETAHSEVISSLYGIRFAQIIAKFDMAKAVDIAKGQVELFNYVLHGTIFSPPKPTKLESLGGGFFGVSPQAIAESARSIAADTRYPQPLRNFMSGLADFLETLLQKLGAVFESTTVTGLQPPSVLPDLPPGLAPDYTQPVPQEGVLSFQGGRTLSIKYYVQDLDPPGVGIETAVKESGHVLGIMTGDGFIYWTNQEVHPSNLELLARQPAIVWFETGFTSKIFIRGKDATAIDAMYGFFRRAGAASQAVRLASTLDFLNYDDRNVVFDGVFDQYSPSGQFVKDSEYPTELGYELVGADEKGSVLGSLYLQEIRQGRYLVARYVGVPIMPIGYVSGTLIAPDYIPVFEARVHHDLGAIIYSLTEEAAPLAFLKDAATFVYRQDAGIVDRPGDAKRAFGNFEIAWRETVPAVSLRELHDQASLGKLRSWNEVVVDTTHRQAKIVGIWNPYGLSGWSRLAKDLGVKEFRGSLSMGGQLRPADLAKKLDDRIDPKTDCLSSAWNLFSVYAASGNTGKPCPIWERLVVRAVKAGEEAWAKDKDIRTGGSETKILPFGAGIVAGFSAIATIANLSDCHISAPEKGAMDLFNNIGLSNLTSIYMKKFDDRCIPPLVETYTCTDGKIYATNIHQPNNKVKVGECAPDSTCSDDGKYCLENPIIPNINKTPGITQYKNIYIDSQTYDNKYIESIKDVCDSLPEYFCRGVKIYIKNTDSDPSIPYCRGGQYHSEDDTVDINGCHRNYDYNNEAFFTYILIHELSHRVQFTLLGQRDRPASKYDNVMYDSFEYYMQWSYSRDNHEEGTILAEEKLERGRRMMQDYFFSMNIPIDPILTREGINNYFQTHTQENFAEFAVVYYTDSLKFKEIFPEVYRYYRDLVFQGIEYKNGVPIVRDR